MYETQYYTAYVTGHSVWACFLKTYCKLAEGRFQKPVLHNSYKLWCAPIIDLPSLPIANINQNLAGIAMMEYSVFLCKYKIQLEQIEEIVLTPKVHLQLVEISQAHDMIVASKIVTICI